MINMAQTNHTYRISDIVAVPHLRTFNSELVHQLIHGGRRGFKSTKHATKIAKRILEDKYCEAIIVREDYTDHRFSTFPALKRAFNRLGVKLIPNVNCSSERSSTLWIKLPQGQYVHFRHMKDIDKLKGTEPIGEENQIKIVWYFEITEFKSSRHIQEANATFIAGEFYWSLYEWNDAPTTTHWTYKFLKEMKKRDDVLIQKVNYNDTPLWQQVKFLGKLLHEIDRLKELQPEQHKSIYLGYPANLGGGCYKSFDPTKHLQPATNNYIDIMIGVDFGGNDATVCTAIGIKPNYDGIEVIDTYYHKNGVSVGINNINQYAKDIMDFAEKVYYSQDERPITMFLDSANNTTMGMLLDDYTMTEDYGYVVMGYLNKMKKRKGSNKKKSAIQERIDVTELMFAANYLTIDNTGDKCEELVTAIQEATYKNGVRLDDKTVNVDSLDSLEYAWLMEMDIIFDTIIMQPLEQVVDNPQMDTME